MDDGLLEPIATYGSPSEQHFWAKRWTRRKRKRWKMRKKKSNYGIVAYPMEREREVVGRFQ